MTLSSVTPERAETLALSALAWILGDTGRADRFLGLTGLTPEILRHGVGDSQMLGAVMAFLAAHEPDLIAAADALSVRPEELVAAGQVLVR